MKRLSQNLIRSVLFGTCMFVLHFVMIPLVCRGWIDFLWIGLMMLLPAVVAWLLYRNHPGSIAASVFPAMLVQYLLLILLAAPVSELWGCSVSRVLGWPEYIGCTFAWPIATAVIQAITIFVIKKSNQ